MKLTQRLSLLLLAGLLFAIAPAAVFAAPDEAGRRLVVQGIITAVEDVDAGTLVTIDASKASDPEPDEHTMLVDADTQIVPADAEPAVGDAAKALVAANGDQLVARKLVLPPSRSKSPPTRPDPAKAARVCGTIQSLPDDPPTGTWIIEDAKGTSHAVIVNDQTQILPRGATPEVGMQACANVQRTSAGLAARQINLQHKVERPKHERRLELRGRVVGEVPDDPQGDWELTLQLPGRNAAQVTVVVTADTEIHGDLAEGAEVVVRAAQRDTGNGDTELVAQTIKVLAVPERPKRAALAAQRVAGAVAAVSDDGTIWTIDTDTGAIDVVVNSETTIVGLTEGDDPTGRQIRGVVKPDADGTLTALQLRLGRE